MRLFGFAIFAAMALTACSSAPTSRVESLRSDGLRPLLTWATQDGPLAVEVLNQPFGAALAEKTSTVIAEGVKQGVTGRVIDTSTRPESRVGAAYTVRVVLDTQASANAQTLCDADAPDAAGSGLLRVVMLFCAHRDGAAWMEGAVRGEMTRPTTPTAPDFQNLIRQMSRQLFVPRQDDKGQRFRALP